MRRRSNQRNQNEAADWSSGERHRGEHQWMLKRLKVGKFAGLVELSAGGNLSLANPVPSSNLNDPGISIKHGRLFGEH
ncbi:hypothetical protein RB5062 [Rhodopirellula baltica SH 1]|uniref:Uncharacterized protein n=1 Tax=Rhodopirellula baltica (strain DSM 10527 / NCIMB 13988 / SH1) TaxID=243090 RepID=Q7UGR5_RHOBA|nr:hypothetical protein RB5062 [Rhodopirellula baltica SH 1]